MDGAGRASRAVGLADWMYTMDYIMESTIYIGKS